MHESPSSFFHSFPRPGSWGSRDSEVTVGMRILESVFKDGLLLTPESLTIPPNPDSSRERPPTSDVMQRRACFTLLDEDALLQGSEHQRAFGSFAIGISSYAGRTIGFLPTIYYYSAYIASAGHLPPDSGLSQQLLFRLGEIRKLLIALAWVEARTGLHQTDEDAVRQEEVKSEEYLERFGLTLDDELDADEGPQLAERLRHLDNCLAKQFYLHINTDRVRAWNLAEWMTILLSLLQTADSKRRNRHLAYFQQREWRVIHAYSPGVTIQSLGDGLDYYRQHFDWSHIIASGSKVDKRHCSLLTHVQGRPFHTLIDTVMVPTSVRSELSDFLSRYELREEECSTDGIITRFVRPRSDLQGDPWK